MSKNKWVDRNKGFHLIVEDLLLLDRLIVSLKNKEFVDLLLKTTHTVGHHAHKRSLTVSTLGVVLNRDQLPLIETVLIRGQDPFRCRLLTNQTPMFPGRGYGDDPVETSRQDLSLLGNLTDFGDNKNVRSTQPGRRVSTTTVIVWGYWKDHEI